MFLVLQILCCFLFAIGFFFVLLDLRTRYDRSFRYIGLSLIFLSSLAAMDMWILPSLAEEGERLFWQRVYHAVACLFIPFSLSYLYLITQRRNSSVPRLFHLSNLCIMPLLFTDYMLTAEGGVVTGRILYYLVYFPYGLLYVTMANVIILLGLRKSRGNERKILGFHLVGFALLSLGGVLDMLGVLQPSSQLFPSYKFLGMLAFGIMAAMVFTERFLMLLKERDATFEKLESAYRDLEQVSVLKQIGESTAIINHEIKNYMFMISGNAQILGEMETLTQKGKDIVRNIVSAVDRLTVFSDDILKMSRVQVTREKHPVNLTELIKGVVDKHYPSRRGEISLLGLERDHFLFGDWGKLEQVFVNLINNAFEACGGGKAEIRIRVTDGNSLLLVSVEDSGIGCDERQLDHLFKAFYTTKKSQGGTGLGMSITRTIVESHGGKISAYSKNLTPKAGSGLKLIMSFPVYAQNLAEEATRKHPIVLVKEGMDNLADIIRIFQNVRVNPYVIQGAAEIKELDLPPDSLTVLVSAKTLASGFTVLSQYPRLCLVSHHERNLHVLDYGRGNRPEVFSEEYVIARLLRKASPRTRLRERQVHTLAA